MKENQRNQRFSYVKNHENSPYNHNPLRVIYTHKHYQDGNLKVDVAITHQCKDTSHTTADADFTNDKEANTFRQIANAIKLKSEGNQQF